MIDVYTTCPSSHNVTATEFRQRIVDVARWTEAAGCRGLLVYSDNSLVDPWATAQLMIDRTATLVPLVALQPAYAHPFTVARLISTIGFLYGRQVDLNLVTGGFAEHLRAIGDLLDHDERYDRLVEAVTIVKKLLTAARPVTHLGDFYGLNGATVTPPLPAELMPRILLSGSSPACVRAQQALGVVRLAYPHAVEEYRSRPDALAGTGMRIGIIARETSEQAWAIAYQRFPADPLGEQMHDMAAGLVESHWHRDLSAGAQSSAERQGAYWRYPFRTYKTFCPYLVGDYETVSELIAGYLRLGTTTVILDVPREEDDLYHAAIALKGASAMAGPTPA